MSDMKKFIPHERPYAKRHEEIEKRMHEEDKRKFGGIFYTDGASKLHVNVLANKNIDVNKILDKEVIIHEAKYSWDYLNQLQMAANSLFEKHGIHATNMSQRNNQIIIGVDKKNADVDEAIRAEMKGLGFADSNAYSIVEKGRAGITNNIEDNDAKIVDVEPNSVLVANETRAAKTIFPGGMLLVKNNNTLVKAGSVNFGYYYNGDPYIVGAGHACSSSYKGNDAYFVPYSATGGYPISAEYLTTNHNSANRFKIGTVALSRVGGAYDLFTIRVTESGINFSRTPYNGWRVTAVGGAVSEGAVLRICGTTTRYDGSYEYGCCEDNQAAVSWGGNSMTNLIQLDIGANIGTSGGPITTYDSDGTVRLVGLASAPGIATCYGVYVQKMMTDYSLTAMQEGTISV